MTEKLFLFIKTPTMLRKVKSEVTG